MAAPPADPSEPANRWPWIALALGALVLVVAVTIFLFSQRSSNVSINVEGTPTANPVARAPTGSAGPPPTLVPPTQPLSAPLGSPAPTATPLPSPTPVPTPASTPTPVVIVVTATPLPATSPPSPPNAATPAAPTAAAVAASPTPAGAGNPTPAAAPTPGASPTPPAAPSPTPFSGQVAGAGGLGNSRSDLDAAYGAPVGETPEHLVVYRKGTFEYHVQLAPDLNGRAALVAALPQSGAPPLTLEAAQAEAHRLLPKDAQPPNPQPEGNTQFVVERYTSQSLAQALGGNPPAPLLAVYARDPNQQNRITRLVVGPGNDPTALLNAGR